MKIFISWSGLPSHAVALAVKDWLQLIFNPIKVFVSSEDIRKGKKWPHIIGKELEETHFGIACLTRDNLNAPWLLFEAGALSKLPESSVSTLLLGGLSPAEIGTSPLSHFQHTTFEKEDFYKLAHTINEMLGNAKHSEVNLRRTFDKWWDELAATVEKALKREATPEQTRKPEDMLKEILDIVSQIAKRMPDRAEVTQPSIRTAAYIEQLTKLDKAQERDKLWTTIVEMVGKKSPFTRSYLLEAQGMFSNGTLTVSFDPEFEDHVGLCNNERNIKLLRTILSELGLGDNCKIVFRVAPATPQVSPAKQR